jgi:hypothetical protein
VPVCNRHGPTAASMNRVLGQSVRRQAATMLAYAKSKCLFVLKKPLNGGLQSYTGPTPRVHKNAPLFHFYFLPLALSLLRHAPADRRPRYTKRPLPTPEPCVVDVCDTFCIQCVLDEAIFCLSVVVGRQPLFLGRAEHAMRPQSYLSNVLRGCSFFYDIFLREPVFCRYYWRILRTERDGYIFFFVSFCYFFSPFL